jgi:hypothetical protein
VPQPLAPPSGIGSVERTARTEPQNGCHDHLTQHPYIEAMTYCSLSPLPTPFLDGKSSWNPLFFPNVCAPSTPPSLARFPLVHMSRRCSVMRHSSPDLQYPTPSTGALLHHRHTAARPPSSVSYHTGLFPSPFGCCGTLVTPYHACRTAST